ncbi:hypothetical protein V8C35DRAFT_318867 [Trichoderma chlorosporum]
MIMALFHQISDDDVLKAPSLAKNQQARVEIALGQQNVFFFTLPFDQGRYATVEIYIKPFRNAAVGHPLFEVEGIYTLSDDDIDVDQVIAAAQLVYDTYINVIWLKLDDVLKCSPKNSSTPSALPDLPASEVCDPVREADSDSFEPRSEVDSEPARNARNISQKPRDRNNPKTVAERLVKAIKEKLPREGTNYDQAAFQCLIPNSGKGYNLEEIKETLLEREAVYGAAKDKVNMWTAWYFRCCLQIVIERVDNRVRYGRKHTPFEGAEVANLVVDNLLKYDGLAAMSVYAALARSGNKLSKAAELSSSNIRYVSDQVAKDLQGKLSAPASSALVPFPGLWLSTLFSIK